METKDIKISEFDYDLPEERIAKFPVPERDTSSLLVYNKGKISKDVFYHLAEYLPNAGVMIFNNTKVIRARMHFFKETGADIEIFLLEPLVPNEYELNFQASSACSWKCLVGNLKKWKSESLTKTVLISGSEVHLTAKKEGVFDNYNAIGFSWDNEKVSFADIIEADGQLPIPPYLKRQTVESDNVTYQTVYSKIKGSVAAPTAGLHFTDRILAEIDKKGIQHDEVTLHVGAGTFKPVKSDSIVLHDMHTETFFVNKSTIRHILENNSSVIAVGTTSVRTIESLYYVALQIRNNAVPADGVVHVSQWEPYTVSDDISPEESLEIIIQWMTSNQLEVLHGSTQIMIAPGYRYHYVKALVTNFHQPRSTLLLLVSAFVNGDWRNIYDFALSNNFRFLSYGDSSLLIP